MAQSVNGFIAKPDHSTPWSDEDWQAYKTELSKHGCIIVGSKTFEIMSKDGDFSDIGNPFVMILSSESLNLSGDFASASSPEEALKELGKRGFTSVIIGGGAKTNSTFLEADLVDEIIIDVEPQMFASGIPFLDSSIVKNDIKLKLISAERISENLVQLHYSVN